MAFGRMGLGRLSLTASTAAAAPGPEPGPTDPNVTAVATDGWLVQAYGEDRTAELLTAATL